MSEPTVDSPGVRLYAAAKGMDKVRALVSVICNDKPREAAERLAAEAERMRQEVRVKALLDAQQAICLSGIELVSPACETIQTLIDEVRK
jgi:hypothetical protein